MPRDYTITAAKHTVILDRSTPHPSTLDYLRTRTHSDLANLVYPFCSLNTTGRPPWTRQWQTRG